jgi:hypothetical protein
MKKVYLTVMLALFSAIMFAQEGDSKKIDVNINTNSGGGGHFWGSPWVWVVGAAIFILLLVALTRGGSSRSAD